MTPIEFCYWLQGALEVTTPESLNETQIKVIQDHLSLVFTKVTPNRQTLKDIGSGVSGAPKAPEKEPTPTQQKPLSDIIKELEKEKSIKKSGPISPWTNPHPFTPNFPTYPYPPYSPWINPNDIICQGQTGTGIALCQAGNDEAHSVMGASNLSGRTDRSVC